MRFEIASLSILCFVSTFVLGEMVHLRLFKQGVPEKIVLIGRCCLTEVGDSLFFTTDTVSFSFACRAFTPARC